MPHERAAEHPTFDLGGTAINECLHRTRAGRHPRVRPLPGGPPPAPAAVLPPHRHDSTLGHVLPSLPGVVTFHIDETC